MQEASAVPVAPDSTSNATGDEAAARRRRRFAVALGAIVLAGLVVRVLAVEAIDPHVGRVSDASAYHLLANNLAAGRGYIRPFDLALLGKTHPTAEYPPLFTAVLAVPAKLGFTSVHSQRLFLTLIGTLTVLLVGLVGRRAGRSFAGGDAVGLAAAALAAVYPMLWQSDAALMSETLYACLVTAALLLAYRAVDRPSPVRWVLLGAVLGLATLTRSEGLVLAIVLIPPLAWRLAKLAGRRRLLLGALALAAAAVVVIPWTVRNAVVFGSFIPVSNNVGALDGANCELTYYGPQLGSWRSTFGLEGSKSGLCFPGFDVRQPGFDESVAARKDLDRGLTYAKDHVGRLVFPVTPARLGRTWGVFRVGQNIDLATLEGRTKRWETLGTWMYWCLAPLAVGGIVVLLRRRALVWPLVATAVGVSVSTVISYGNTRFRIAAEPAIVVAAAVALVAIVTAARGRGAPAPAVSEPESSGAA